MYQVYQGDTAMLDASFKRRVDELRDCDSVGDFIAGMRRFAGALGFSNVQFRAIRRVSGISRLNLIEERGDVARYDRAIEIGDLDDIHLTITDPVIAWLRSSSLPLIWGRDTYLSAGLVDFYDSCLVSASQGNGIALRSILPSTSDVDVAIQMQRHEKVGPHHEMSLTAAVSLLVCYCNHFTDRVLWPEYLKKVGDTSPLTPSQAECIYWAAQGLSVKETAKALGKSPATVGNTIQAAMRRIDCSRKEQAVRLCLENKWFPAHLPGRQKS